jgi:flavin-dependent dehydrogenase
MTFDPLSSQGLMHALFSGLAAAEAADSYLCGDSAAPARYHQMMHGIQGAYQRRLAFSYSAETRWPWAPFWQRRQFGGLHQP